jgi:hypothetical protein
VVVWAVVCCMVVGVDGGGGSLAARSNQRCRSD